MALKVHKVVVVSCPRCVFTGGVKDDEGKEREGVGKSCFCNRFVRPDCFSLHHTSILTDEQEWRDNSVYNGDHFLYWGAATKRLPDGTRARFQVVEQTEFYSSDYKPLTSTADRRDYIERATATHFISRGKVAYRLHSEEEYAIPSSLKHNKSSRATQLFPNHEFSDGKGSTSFICLFDPTLRGEDIKIQVEFLTKLIKEIVKNKCKVVLACTKCDEVNKGRIDLGANLAATVAKKPIPYIQTSAKEGINVEETFFHVISAIKTKRNFSKSSGKNSPANLIPSYSDVLQSRNLDSTYSTAAFNQLLKDTVVDFSTEWSDAWPRLQFNPSCVRAVEVLGLEKIRKMYCQRLMELKVQEIRGRQRSGSLPSKVLQNELSEAFRNHPDLGTDSLYDFVYSPSSTPVSRMTRNSISSEAPPTPIATPTAHIGTLPIDIASSPPMIVSSPPPPPPTSSIPTPTKSVIFSPTHNSSLTLPPDSFMRKNRSQEILSTLQEIPDDHSSSSYHGSIRFRNRTLPPLPNQEHFSPTRRLSSDSFTTSHPQLHDSTTSFTSNNSMDRKLHRRLSTSMDCLPGNGPLFEEGNEEDVDASPYLCPVDIRKAIQLRPDKAASCKLPRQRPRPAIPFDDSAIVQRSQSFRSRSATMPSPPIVPKRSPLPPPSSPTHMPTQPKTLNVRKESPLLLGMTVMSPGGGQSSLDFPNDQIPIGGGTRILVESSSNEQLDETSSVASGPFAEISDDVTLDDISEGSATLSTTRPDYYQYRSKSHTPDLHSYSSSTLPARSHGSYYNNKSAGSLLVPLTHSSRPSSSSHTSPEKENLYASIPADDEYLTMTAGVSLEELLSTSKQHRNTSAPKAQLVIKKLKSVTRSKGSFRKNSERDFSHPPKKFSEASHKSFDAAFERMSKYSTMGSSFSYHRPSVSSTRPLPPSPTKGVRGKSGSPTKRKISGTGDRDNIYESIDENEEWFRQLRLERELRYREKMIQVSSVDPQLALQCSAIMESFLKIPQVQEHWLATVQSYIPNFNPPKEASIPPFTINPEYIIGYTSGSSRHRLDIEEGEGDVEQGDDTHQEEEEQEEEEEEGEEETEEEEEREKGEEEEIVSPLTPQEFNNNNGHRKLAMTDSVLMRMNRSLQQDSSSSSSSSSSEEEDSDDDDEQYDYDLEQEMGRRNLLLNSDLPWPLSMGQTDTLQSDIVPPLVIQQCHYGLERDDELIITSPRETRSDVTQSSSSEEEEHNNNAITEADNNGEKEESENESSVSDIIPQVVLQSGYNNTSINLQQQTSTSDDLVVMKSSHTIPHAVQNGHLSVCQLNSLDSGISATNGD